MARRGLRKLVLGALAGLACFGLGLGAARLLGWSAPATAPAAIVLSAPAPSGLRLTLPAAEPDAGPGPKILFDPDSITLLPDASLRLDLPGRWDAGG